MSPGADDSAMESRQAALGRNFGKATNGRSKALDVFRLTKEVAVVAEVGAWPLAHRHPQEVRPECERLSADQHRAGGNAQRVDEIAGGQWRVAVVPGTAGCHGYFFRGSISNAEPA